MDGGPDEEDSAIARCEEPYEFGWDLMDEPLIDERG